ncbi:MAG TPA: DUF4339 domain-containing protein [Thermoguttaceae bacterium]|nr:DUF4339 domain-containing protein [Thermoguttaceae bacterium]
MAVQWYYGRGGQQHGPVTTQQLQKLLASGQLQPSDLVWREGMAEWTAAEKVEGLVPKPESTVPGLPPQVAVPSAAS